MTKKFSLPRGTSDILPDEISAWQNLEETARRILKNYRYQEIRTPMFEETGLFVRSLGAATDVVQKQMLNLASMKDSPDSLGNDEGLSLRPEATASIVRSYLQNNFDKKESLSKLYYIGPMFRGERPQKGRLRQFHQIGCEAIGPDSSVPFLDAEIISLSVRLLNAFGANDLKLKINSLGTPEDKKKFSVILRDHLQKNISSLCEDCQKRFERNVFRILDCKNESCKKVVAGLNLKDEHLSTESQKYFTEVKEALKSLDVSFEVSPALVRGLDYYIHTVFEITAGGLGSQDAVGAGGRYDGLIQELGGSLKINYGAIGFALGIERILLSRGNTIKFPNSLDAFVVYIQSQYAFQLVNQLRQANISADMSFSTGSFKSQMSRAHKLNARFALILGEEEIKNKTVAVKNMLKSTQETVPLEDIIDYLRKAL